jgi:uncharacterized phiE125 gp8 family phage protein
MRTTALAITDTFISSVAEASPPVSALTLDYAKLHIRSLTNLDDALIAVNINGAAMYFEEQTARALLTQTHEAWLDAFPFIGASGMHARIELPNPPLQAVLSIEYIDPNGVLQSFTDGASPPNNLYTVSAPAGPFARRGFVEPIHGQTWPIARRQTGAVRIRYTCGYGDSQAAIPELAQGVLCYLVGNFDQVRQAAPFRTGYGDFPVGIEILFNAFKYSALPSEHLREYGRAHGLGLGLGIGGGWWGGW